MKKTIYALGLLALTTVTSCTDNTYDLSKNNVDWSMQASSDVLWLPDGSTANAMLKDLFSVSEGQNLKLIEDPETGRGGLYCMQGDGSITANVTLPVTTAGWNPVTIDEPSTTVSLGNIPEFLRREETNFDIVNPIILISVNSEGGMSFRSSIVITSMKDGDLVKTAQTADPTIPDNDAFVVSDDAGVQNFYIAAQKVTDNELPIGFKGAKFVDLEGSTFREMLRDMPDEFKIELTMNEGSGTADTKKFEVNYSLWAPMRPGEDFKLNDDDRADGFKSDLKDVLFEGMAVRADVVGDMPMTVRLEPVAINEKGEVLNDVKLTIDGKSFVEVPGDDRTTILVTLTATGGKRVSDFVNRDVNYFDGIRFDFTILKPTQPGAKIFSDMKVRLEDMKMGIIGAGYDGN
jgi:hypothetical protein